MADAGKIITFYSYKGGTGRSMALANVAWILASSGKRVLTIDWDLEAPGLHRYFYPFLIDKDLTYSEGIIDFIIEYSMAALTPPGSGDLQKDWFLPYANILRYATSLNWPFEGQGKLDFIPAGRQGPSYSTRVNSFDWQDFYNRLGGWAFLEAAKEKMRAEYDYILIDSRTGVSDTSGICTVQMPDTLVVCYLLNNQSIDGSAAVAASVYEQRQKSLRVFPIAMRVENSEKEKRDFRREYARDIFDAYTEELRDKERYRSKVQFPYVPYYAYEEILATFGDKPEDTNTLLESAERLTSFLTNGSVNEFKCNFDLKRRREVLTSYAQLPKSKLSIEPPDEFGAVRRVARAVTQFARKSLERPVPFWFVMLLLIAAAGPLIFTVKQWDVAQEAGQLRQQLSLTSDELGTVRDELNLAKKSLEVAQNNQAQVKYIADLEQQVQEQGEFMKEMQKQADIMKQQATSCRQARLAATQKATQLQEQLDECRASGSEDR